MRKARSSYAPFGSLDPSVTCRQVLEFTVSPKGEPTITSYLDHLECTVCGESYSTDEPNKTCTACGKVLFARYDLDRGRKEIDRDAMATRPANMWRYQEVMPVRQTENIATLGEGMTPLLHAARLGHQLGCSQLLIKDEGTNPTGTFKARGMSAAVSKAKELGLTRLTIARGGNAPGAMAAYCARANIEAHIFLPKAMPETIPLANQYECQSYGARLTLVDGSMDDAMDLMREQTNKLGLFDISTLREPYRVEGKKTMGYELAEQLGWRTPDVIVYPTGGGTGIVGIWKAFKEMQALGWINEITTRMITVQPAVCAPIVKAFHDGSDHIEPLEVEEQSIASGIGVPAPFADYLILQVLRESNGTAVAVSEDEILDAIKLMGSAEGISSCPEAAATLAGLRRLIHDGAVDASAEIVLLNTGSAQKYTDVLVRTRQL